jgi:hypothetical protein
MQKEIIIGMVITIVLLLLVIIWAIFVRKEKFARNHLDAEARRKVDEAMSHPPSQTWGP